MREEGSSATRGVRDLMDVTDLIDRRKNYRLPITDYQLYRFRLHRNDLTAEGALNAEGENTEMNNSDATGFDITHSQFPNCEILRQKASQAEQLWVL